MKTKTRILTLSLAMALCLAPLSASAPQTLEFSRADFARYVPDERELTGIVITALPDAEDGTLLYGVRDLMIGEAVPAEGLDMLRFIPADLAEVRSGFEFLPVWADGVALDSVAVSLNLQGRDNRPPTTESQDLTTYRNIALTQPFSAADPDGDPLNYKITVKPRRGEIELRSDGTFVYTPYQNKTGRDTFKYVATDSHGNMSDEAEVRIKIDKPSTKVTYADMGGQPAHYAALRMAEQNVFTGERVGQDYYFYPDRDVTRGEFIAMALQAVGMAEDLVPTTRTGFADDARTPAWIKPYAAAALKAGIIAGVSAPDGGAILAHDAVLSKAEAAVILNNAIRLTDAGAAPVFADEAAIPVWAYQAAVNLEAAGVLQTDSEGAIGLSDSVSRAEAVTMLESALEVQRQSQQKPGLLSWAFG